MSLGFGRTTPVQRHMLQAGMSPGPPPPRDGHRATLVVRDADSLDCETTKYPLLGVRYPQVYVHAAQGEELEAIEWEEQA
jgi:hypothetical protein